MELNEIHNEHEHASLSLKILLLIFAVVLVGVLGYLVWQQNSTDTNPGGDTIIIPVKTTTYTDTTNKFTFNYPSSLTVDTTSSKASDVILDDATHGVGGHWVIEVTSGAYTAVSLPAAATAAWSGINNGSGKQVTYTSKYLTVAGQQALQTTANLGDVGSTKTFFLNGTKLITVSGDLGTDYSIVLGNFKFTK